MPPIPRTARRTAPTIGAAVPAMPASALCRGHRSPSAMRCLRQRNARPHAPTQCPGDSTTRCSHQPTLASSCPPQRVSYGRSRGADNGRSEKFSAIPVCSITGTNPSDRIAPWINTTGAPDPRTSYSMSAPFSCTRSIRGLQSFSQSLCDEKGVAGLLQAHDLAVSDCPEMGESGLHLPPLLRNAEIASENDHVIARLEVLVSFRVELVEVSQECEEIINNSVDTAIDAPLGNPSAISYSRSSARSDLKIFTFPLASYNFRMRVICDVPDIRTFLRLMLMAHSRATPK